ncbi:DUF4442 domain-containing protein [Flavicella marina]|uniref:DUF4442 domain-containing protein n=1 Tax=Flavicella marina TaxID=1475951 RepID=UPI0012647B18|nr:DUF4442 domain-containing protein [Flavicella marina]
MSIYKKLTKLGLRFFSKRQLFKYGFNNSPMYRRSTGRVVYVSEDLLKVTVKIPLSWKNRNYVNSIFGGSLFASVDPIPMIQLIYILDSSYVIWDKSAQINFKRPAKQAVYAYFSFSTDELNSIRDRVAKEKEITIQKITQIVDKNQTQVFCEVNKTIYIADKTHYKEKLRTKVKV